MDVSIFLAKALGLYLVILSVPMLLHVENFFSIIAGIFHNASIQFVLGMNVLILGILMVLFHNNWAPAWTMLITILAWITLLKGILYVVFPKTVNAMSQSMLRSSGWLRVSGAINLIIGGYLCYMGFYVGMY